MKEKPSRLTISTFDLLVANQKLLSLAIYILGVEPLSWAFWRQLTPNADNFLPEVRSKPTTDPYHSIPDAIRKMVGFKTLTIGYTKELYLVGEIAKATGAEEMIVRFRKEWGTQQPLMARGIGAMVCKSES